MPTNAQVKVDSLPSGAWIFDRRYAWVWVKAAWADQWTLVRYMMPIMCAETISPIVPKAELAYFYGMQKREDKNAFAQERPHNYLNHYVRIQSISSVYTIQNAWHGIIVDHGEEIEGTKYDPSGIERYTAYGLEHLLDRTPITGAYCWQNSAVIDIGATPDFNMRSKHGRRLLGNRSTAEHGDVYVFSREGAVWNYRQIAEYLLEKFGPEEVTFKITGQLDQLAHIEQTFSYEGLTLKQALDKLIDRRRGLAWRCQISQAGNIEIVVFSITGEDTGYGHVSLVPNGQPFDINIGADIRKRDVMFTRSASTMFNKIIIRGQNAKTCFSLSFNDLNIEEGWVAADETAYKAESDLDRAKDEYERVYRFFRAPRDWDWKAGYGNGENKSAVSFGFDDSGNIIYSGSPEEGKARPSDIEAKPSWMFAKGFERFLPLKKETTKEEQEPEYLEPFVICKDPEHGDIYFFINKMDKEMARPSANVRMVDREMAVLADFNPAPHIFALNHMQWDDNDPHSKYRPEYDYKTMIATVFMETDHPIQVVENIKKAPRTEATKTLVITIPDAEFWYIAPGTIIGLREDGYVNRYRPSGTELPGEPNEMVGWYILRDDRDRLREIMALAKVWYSKERAAVKVVDRRIGHFGICGKFVRNIRSGVQPKIVNTIISSVQWNFVEGTTTIETAFLELDVTKMSAREVRL